MLNKNYLEKNEGDLKCLCYASICCLVPRRYEVLLYVIKMGLKHPVSVWWMLCSLW